MSTDLRIPVEPAIGGEVHTDTSAWPFGSHHVWLTVNDYARPERSADAVLHPREALRVAARLAVCAVAVWLRRVEEAHRGR